MISKKFGLLWAASILLLTSMSWGTRDNPVGHPDNFGSSYDWRAVRLELIMGSSSNKTFPSGISWTRVLNEDGKLQDLEENGGTGDDGYVYMAYEKSTFLCGMNTSNDPVLLPAALRTILRSAAQTRSRSCRRP